MWPVSRLALGSSNMEQQVLPDSSLKSTSDGQIYMGGGNGSGCNASGSEISPGMGQGGGSLDTTRRMINDPNPGGIGSWISQGPSPHSAMPGAHMGHPGGWNMPPYMCSEYMQPMFSPGPMHGSGGGVPGFFPQYTYATEHMRLFTQYMEDTSSSSSSEDECSDQSYPQSGGDVEKKNKKSERKRRKKDKRRMMRKLRRGLLLETMNSDRNAGNDNHLKVKPGINPEKAQAAREGQDGVPPFLNKKLQRLLEKMDADEANRVASSGGFVHPAIKRRSTKHENKLKCLMKAIDFYSKKNGSRLGSYHGQFHSNTEEQCNRARQENPVVNQQPTGMPSSGGGQFPSNKEPLEDWEEMHSKVDELQKISGKWKS